MTERTPEGGIVPAHVRVSPMPGPEAHHEMLGLYRGFVQRVVPPDDDDNVTGRMEYVVTVGGQDYPGALDMTGSGGIYQNAMRIRKGVDVANESGAPVPVLDDTYEEKKDGEIVFCMFLNGDGDCPIIIGGDRHPLVDTVNEDYQELDGLFDRFEYNGFEFLIDPDGNYTITMIGMKDPTTNFVTNTDAVGSVFTFNVDGDFSFMTAGGTLVTINNAEDSVSIICNDEDQIVVSKADGIQMSTPASGGTSISCKSGVIEINAAKGFILNSDDEGFEITTATDLKATVGGDLNASVDGDTVLTLSGKLDAAVTGDVTLQTDGKAEVTAQGDVSLESSAGKASVKAAQDISVESSGGKVDVKGATELSFKDATGAGVHIAAGKTALGNSGGEVFAILNELVTALSTTTAAGFGAPISCVAQMPAILVKITAAMGSL